MTSHNDAVGRAFLFFVDKQPNFPDNCKLDKSSLWPLLRL